jgi:hypothetical protein
LTKKAENSNRDSGRRVRKEKRSMKEEKEEAKKALLSEIVRRA